MGHRVNIQYSLDLEDLPTEMEGLIAKAEDRLARCHREIQTLIEASNPKAIMTTACTDEISNVREGLADADFILNDVVTIIHSYVEYKVAKRERASGPPASPPGSEEISDVEYENQLEQQVKAFKDSLT